LGRVCTRIESDDVDLSLALADEGLIDPRRDDDPDEIRRGLRRLVERWLARWRSRFA
jgi:hypothetical protein